MNENKKNILQIIIIVLITMLITFTIHYYFTQPEQNINNIKIINTPQIKSEPNIITEGIIINIKPPKNEIINKIDDIKNNESSKIIPKFKTLKPGEHITKINPNPITQRVD